MASDAPPVLGRPRRFHGCITADGVQLRQAAFADWDTPYVFRKIERRCVASSEVTPPIGLIDIRPSLGLDDPVGPEATNDATNYEVVLEARGAVGRLEREILRRRGAVVLKDTYDPGGTRRMVIVNETRGVGWWTGWSREGRANDMLFQQTPPTDRPERKRPRIEGRPDGRLLGETCHWMGDSGAVIDGTIEICETADGITLIVNETSWGAPRAQKRAVSLTRGRVSREDVSPPGELMQPGYWGFPDA